MTTREVQQGTVTNRTRSKYSLQQENIDALVAQLTALQAEERDLQLDCTSEASYQSKPSMASNFYGTSRPSFDTENKTTEQRVTQPASVREIPVDGMIQQPGNQQQQQQQQRQHKTDEENIKDMEETVRILEEHLAIAKERAVQEQRKRELREKIRRMQEELKSCGRLEDMTMTDYDVNYRSLPQHGPSSSEQHQEGFSPSYTQLPVLSTRTVKTEQQGDEWLTSLESNSSTSMGRRVPAHRSKMKQSGGDRDDDIGPGDSASNISRRQSSVSSRGSTSSVKRAMIREMELAAKVAATKTANEIKQKKRQLLRQLQEAVMQHEEEKQKLESAEIETTLNAEYEAAKAATRILQAPMDDCVPSSLSIPAASSTSVPGNFESKSEYMSSPRDAREQHVGWYDGHQLQSKVRNQRAELDFQSNQMQPQRDFKSDAEKKNLVVQHEESSKTEQNMLVTLLDRLVSYQKESSLPTPDLEYFDGSDLLKYPTFLKNFKLLVEEGTSNQTRRLELLLKYTKGEAHQLIQDCTLLKDPSEAYDTAISLLQRDYGNPVVLAAAYRQKVEKWPQIPNGDKEALRKFAIFMNNCCQAKKTNPDLNHMDGFDFLKMVAQKLPIALQQRWIEKVGRCRDEELRSPTMEDFEHFVTKLARNENDPRIEGLGYQKRVGNDKRQAQPGKGVTKRQAYATSVSKNVNSEKTTNKRDVEGKPRSSQNKTASTGKTCIFCGPDTKHGILECRKFTALKHEEKSQFCRTEGLCYGCLKAGHTRKQCKAPENCTKCSRRHPTVLHDPHREPRTPENKDQKENSTLPQVTSGCVNTNNRHSDQESRPSGPLMTIVPILVKTAAGNQPIETYAFVDNGCGAVFAAEELCRKLHTRTRKTTLFLKTLNSEETMDTDVIQDKLQIGDLSGNTFLDLPDVYMKDVMPVTDNDIPRQEDIDKWTHLQNIRLPDLSKNKNCIPRVTLMIGSNVPAATQPIETRTGKIGEPYAVRSPLGWLIYGVISGNTQEAVAVHFSKVRSHTSIQSNTENLEELFKEYMNRDFNERSDEVKPSLEDQKFLQIMEESITKEEDGHYKTALPFRDRTKLMPNNYLQAVAFADRLKKRLQNNTQLHQQYSAFMSELEDKKYAERVPEQELESENGRVWYIPHHNVRHPRKPEKVRVVYNCPVKYMGTSLNDELLQGPDLTNRLFGVLLRWRQEQIAIMADIESMFCQVRVNAEDTDMLRYLWWPAGDLSKDPVVYRMLVHVFGAVSSPSIANLALKKMAKDNEHKYSKEIIDTVNNDFYVDDLLKSTATEDKAIEMARNIKEAVSQGGFNLTKWLSNSRKVLEAIPRSDRAKEVKSLELDMERLPTQRALGVHWNVEEDTLGFVVSEVSKKPTRRNILSMMSSVYDPLGFTAPFILKARILLQKLCREKLSWDEEIPVHHRQEWEKWLKELAMLKGLKVNRCYKPEGFPEHTKIEIHHFADASEHAYGIVSYIRYLSGLEEKVHCSFVTAKARVAPVKPVTIPRLELTAATVAVRVNAMLMKEIEIPVDEVHYWTDSQTVLRYINNEKTRFRTFVANRVEVIHEGSHPSQWHYIESANNPADDASRGLTMTKLLKTERWFQGPQFLWSMNQEWPIWSNKEGECDESLEGDKEVKEKSTAQTRSKPPKESIQVNVVKSTEQPDSVATLIAYFSCWTRLRRAVGWWLRLKTILFQRSKKQQAKEESKSLTVDEINQAEAAIVKFVQRQAYPEEISELENAEKASNNHSADEADKIKSQHANQKQMKKIRKTSNLTHLDPVLNHGILKVGGRLRLADIPEDAKHPWILPKDHHVTKVIIRHAHEMCNHQGKNHVMNELRQRYWIIKGGVAVKAILKQCTICRRHRAKPCTQKMADLPASRVKSCDPPFTYTGVDFFGPFNIKQGRSEKKRYGVIFTCMNSRAVHLETAESMDTSSCVNALRRFVCRRGQVKEITSDNGSNLCGADRELRRAVQELDPQVLHTWAANRGIKWKYNPPAASHHGGVWERLIRSVRQILQSTLREQHVKVARSEEQLQTLLCEVENTLNSRPLTKVSEDPSDLDVITPNHLLQPRNQEQYPPGKFTEEDKYARQRWRQVKFLADLFWKRWVREYLPTLQRRQKWLYPERNYQVGDIVLVADPQAPRNSWLMGKIQSIHEDSQGYVRSAKIQTKSTSLTRPITKLCLLLEHDT